MSAVISRIDQAGRISISAQQRRALGLEAGSPIVINIVGSELRIRSMNVAIAELQVEAGQFLQNDAASVDAFIAQRHSNAQQEEGQTQSHPKPALRSRPELEPEQNGELEPELEQEPESEMVSKLEVERVSEPEPTSEPEPEPERVSKPKTRTGR